jgi:hypothetical protein
MDRLTGKTAVITGGDSGSFMTGSEVFVGGGLAQI